MKKIFVVLFFAFSFSSLFAQTGGSEHVIKGVKVQISENKIWCVGPFGTCVILNKVESQNPDPPDSQNPNPYPNEIDYIYCKDFFVEEQGDTRIITWIPVE